MTTLREAAKSGYGLSILAVHGIAKACGTKFRDLYRLQKRDEPRSWTAPAWLVGYGLYDYAQRLEM